MTLREEVNQIFNEIREKQDMMTPMIAADKLNYLSVLHARLTSIIAERQFKYIKMFNDIVEGGDTALGRCEIKAKATKEWNEYNEAVLLEKSLTESIRSLKIWIKTRMHEEEQSKNL